MKTSELHALVKKNPEHEVITGVPGFTFGPATAGICKRCGAATIVFRGLGVPMVCTACAKKQRDEAGQGGRRNAGPKSGPKHEQPVDAPPAIG